MAALLQNIQLLETPILKGNFGFGRFRNAFITFSPMFTALFQFYTKFKSSKEKTLSFQIYFGVFYFASYPIAV